MSKLLIIIGASNEFGHAIISEGIKKKYKVLSTYNKNHLYLNEIKNKVKPKKNITISLDTIYLIPKHKSFTIVMNQNMTMKS